MKLLTKPQAKVDEVKLGGSYTVKETHFNPLGVFGLGPLTTTRDVVKYEPVQVFAGRLELEPVEIDFEDFDPAKNYFNQDKGYLSRTDVDWQLDLEFEDKTYRFYRIMPFKLLRDNVWQCTFDYWEELA